MNEQWKQIPICPNYSISTSGTVKRITKSRGTKPGKVLKPSKYPKTGYLYVVIRSKHHLVHRLVAITHLGFPPTPKYQCNHKDGNKLNNNLSNLEWVTHKQNAEHSYSLGLTKKPPTLRGEQSTSCTISEDTAQIILDTPKKYGSGKALADKFGISKYIVSSIRNRKSWKHLHPKHQESLDLSLQNSG